MQGLGRHLLADFYGCNPEQLNNVRFLSNLALDAVRRSGATIMSQNFQEFEPQGVSGVIIIAESHLSFHTWPEHGYVAVDYFTCGDTIDIQAAIDLMERGLKPSRSTRNLYERGTELGAVPYRPDPANEPPDPRAPRHRVMDEAGDVERWATEYHRDRASGRRMLGYQYLVGGSPLVHRRSACQDILVAESPAYGRMLFLDNMLMTTERDGFVYHEMLAHVPLLLHPEPRRVLVIGGGDGGLLGQVLKHQAVQHVELVEIDEEVIEVCRAHLPGSSAGFDDPRVRIHVQDGARFAARQPDNAYDVVLVDSTDPVGPGLVLFQAPFFRDIRRILGNNGVLAAQSLSPFLQRAEQQDMYRQLGSVWPHVLAYHATVPTYPGAMWTFALCSERSVDLTRFDRARARGIAESCRYYTPELQVAAFHLPRFVTESTVRVSQAARDEREGQPASSRRRGHPAGDEPQASG